MVSTVLVCVDTHEEAWDKLLALLEEEKQTVMRESEYEPKVEIFEDSYEATLHYQKGDKADYFIVCVDI